VRWPRRNRTRREQKSALLLCERDRVGKPSEKAESIALSSAATCAASVTCLGLNREKGALSRAEKFAEARGWFSRLEFFVGDDNSRVFGGAGPQGRSSRISIARRNSTSGGLRRSRELEFIARTEPFNRIKAVTEVVLRRAGASGRTKGGAGTPCREFAIACPAHFYFVNIPPSARYFLRRPSSFLPSLSSLLLFHDRFNSHASPRSSDLMHFRGEREREKRRRPVARVK